MDRNKAVCLFKGFEVEGTLYPSDRVPQKLIEKMNESVRSVLFSDIKASVLGDAYCKEKK